MMTCLYPQVGFVLVFAQTVQILTLNTDFRESQTGRDFLTFPGSKAIGNSSCPLRSQSQMIMT